MFNEAHGRPTGLGGGVATGRVEDGFFVEVGEDDPALDGSDFFMRFAEPEGGDLGLIGGVEQGFFEAVHDESAQAAHLRIGQRLDDYLSPDAAGIAHGDADEGPTIVVGVRWRAHAKPAF